MGNSSFIPRTEHWGRKQWEWGRGRALWLNRKEVGLSKELPECYKPPWWLSAELSFASQVFFIESVCNDPNVVATNVMVSVEL